MDQRLILGRRSAAAGPERSALIRLYSILSCPRQLCRGAMMEFSDEELYRNHFQCFLGVCTSADLRTGSILSQLFGVTSSHGMSPDLEGLGGLVFPP